MARVQKRVIVTGSSLRIQDVARLFDVSTRTLIRLEEDGKIGKVPRSRAGHRRFTSENIRKIQQHCPKAARNVEGRGTEILILPPKKAEALTIGEVAQQFGTHVRTIQRLEDEGKIGPIPRDRRGHRRFRPEDLAQLRKVFFEGKVVNPPWVKPKGPTQ